MRSIAIVLLLVFGTSVAAAPVDDTALQDAQTAFRRGIENKGRLLHARKDFSEATNSYLVLHKRGYRSTALYRNLGNAAMLADRWPEAIWAYQTGLRLDANDRSMRENLALARGKVIYPAGSSARLEADVWPIWLHRPTFGELAATFALFYTLAWVLGAWAYSSRSFRLLMWTLLAGQIALLAAAAFAFQMHQADIDQRTPLAIVAENTPFYRGNGPSYPQHAAVPVLPRGIETRIIHRRGDWLQVRLTTGEVGWLPKGVVLIVEP